MQGAQARVEVDSKTKAVFLDRDGTLIRNHHYGCDPKKIELLDGVVEGMLSLQADGYKLIVVTNQSGIARGYFDERQLLTFHHRLISMLIEKGITPPEFYYCPHHAEGTVPPFSFKCRCRKPEPGMLLRAARDHRVDLPSSWLIGDILDDVEAGNRAGCRTVLIDVGTESLPATVKRTPLSVAKDFKDAALFILRSRLRVRSLGS